MHPVPSPPGEDKESAAERWARWKATDPSSRPGRGMTRKDKRRLAQRGSVKARRRNAAERRRRVRALAQAARDEVKWLQRTGVEFITNGLFREMPQQGPSGEGNQDLLPVTWINRRMLTFVKAVFQGRDLLWVRKLKYERERKIEAPRPVKASWDCDWYYLPVAVSIHRVIRINDDWSPYWHEGYIYFFKAHDFLSHFEKKTRFSRPGFPAETVPWDSLLEGNVIYLHGLQTPSPRQLVRAIMEAWVELGRDKVLPWSGPAKIVEGSGSDEPTQSDSLAAEQGVGRSKDYSFPGSSPAEPDLDLTST